MSLPAPGTSWRFVPGLRQRRVLGVGIVYVAMALAAIEAADLIFPRLGLPDWATNLVLGLALVCFPLALVLAWASTPLATTSDGAGSGLGPRLPGRWWGVAAAAVVLALAGAIVLRTRPATPADAPDRTLVAVLPFERLTDERALAGFGALAADVVVLAVNRSGVLEAIPRSVTGPGGAGAADRSARLRAVSRATGAGTVVSGSYFAEGGEIVVHGEIVDAGTLRLIEAIGPVTGASQREVAETFADAVSAALAHHLYESPVPWTRRYRPPPNLEAFREIGRAQELFAAGRWGQAVPHYWAAWHAAPGFAAPLLDLAVAARGAGAAADADSALDLLEGLAVSLNDVERVALEWIRAQVIGDRARVHEMARRGFRLDPVGWSHAAGSAALRNRHPGEALEYLRAADTDDPFYHVWDVYWNVRCEAHLMRGEYRDALATGDAAVARFPDRNGPRLCRVRALAGLGRVARVLDAVRDAERAAAPDGLDPVILGHAAADNLLLHGHPREAAELRSRVLALHEGRARTSTPGGAADREHARGLVLSGRAEEARAFVAGFDDAGAAGAARDAVTALADLADGDRGRAGDRLDRLLRDAERGAGAAVTVWGLRLAAALEDDERAARFLRLRLDAGGYGYSLVDDPFLTPLRTRPGIQEILRARG